MEKSYDIRYIKLHFEICFCDDYDVQKYKTSALRGGMGEMLLRSNCTSDRDCKACSFQSECVVQRIMYSQMAIPCKYANGDCSVGYIIECEDYRTKVHAGDLMRFNIVLFGNTIVYFSQILNALYGLGQLGVGKEEAKYQIVSITNSEKEPLLYENDILMKNFKVHLVSDYIKYRRNQIDSRPINNVIKLQTPLCVKYKGVKLEDFDVVAFFKSLQRRIYTLDCFEGIESNITEHELEEVPCIVDKEYRQVSMKRYSYRKESHSILSGIEGNIKFSEIPDVCMDLLLAGELVHVGNSTSFGLGRYRVM